MDRSIRLPLQRNNNFINPVIWAVVAQMEIFRIFPKESLEACLLRRIPITPRVVGYDNQSNVIAPNAIHENLGIRNRRKPNHMPVRVMRNKLRLAGHQRTF